MRKRKLVIIVRAVGLLCFTAFAACTDKTDYGTLTVADVTVTVGQSKDLTPEFSKEEGKGEVSYTFSGSNISIADGKVTGLVAGTDTIVTATTEHLSALFKVTVVSPDYGTLTIEDITVEQGKEKDINPQFSKEEGRGEVSYTFSGSNISIADGKVKGLVAGTETEVTAKTENLTAEFTVTVTEINRGTLTIEDITLEADGNARIRPVFSVAAGEAPVEYDFIGDDIRIEDGIVYAVNPDTTTTVKATTQYHETYFDVIVKPIDYGQLNISLPKSNYEDQANTLYANYSARELSVEFTKPAYEDDIVYEIPAEYADRITITDNKIKAVGDFSTPKVVTITAKTQHHTEKFAITVTNFNGKNHMGNSLNLENTVKNRLSDWTNRGGDQGGVLFMGDSFFDTGFWSDFYTTYGRKNAYTMGISATTTTDWEYMVERLVFPVQPKAVVIHCGTNNIFDDNKAASAATDDVKRLFNLIHANLPEADIYYFGIEPRVGRDNSIPKAVNENIIEFADENDWLTYIDSPSWCYDTDGSVISSFFRDGVHPTLANYAKYVKALDDLGLVIDNNSAASDTSIADISTTAEQSINAGNTFALSYRGLPLTNEYVLTGKLDITVEKTNPHIQFLFNDGNRFLVWDGEGNGSMGLAWQASGTHMSDDDDLYSYTTGTKFTVLFKLAVTDKNAYFYFGSEDGGSVTYTLNSVFVNVSATKLVYGTENVAAKLYGLTAKTKLDDAAEYAALVKGSEFDYYEHITESVPDGIYVSIPSATGVFVIRDSKRANNYIDYSKEFYLKGVGNNDANYSGISRDWQVVAGGKSQFSGDFAMMYDMRVVGKNLEAIDSADSTNISAQNWFHYVAASKTSKIDVWNQYYLFYISRSGAATEKDKARLDAYFGKAASVTGTANKSDEVFTATQLRVGLIRSGDTLYIAMKVNDTWYISENAGFNEVPLTLWIGAENVNGQISNFSISESADDVTAALTEIGKNA